MIGDDQYSVLSRKLDDARIELDSIDPWRRPLSYVAQQGEITWIEYQIGWLAILDYWNGK